MVKFKFYKNIYNQIIAFETSNHAKDKIICSALSILVFNTINSIEKFTDEKFLNEMNEQNAQIHFEFINSKNKKIDEKAELLLNSLLFGIESIKNDTTENISIKIEEV